MGLFGVGADIESFIRPKPLLCYYSTYSGTVARECERLDTFLGAVVGQVSRTFRLSSDFLKLTEPLDTLKLWQE
jgi:hypothetical protein